MDIWSYAPLISKLSIDTTQPFLLLQAVCTQDVRSSSADKVDLLLRPPIWFHGRRLCSSAAPRHYALLWVNGTARLPTLPCLAWRLLALHNAGLATRREAAPGGPVDAEFAP